MNLRRPLVLATATFLMGGLVLAETKTFSIPVRVNGQPIISSEVREAVQAQEQLIRAQIRDPKVAEAKLAELRDSALYALIERQLVLSEFQKLGGTIKPEYVEDDINNIIRESFDGDRDKFVYELQKTGMSMKKFR